MATTGPVEDTSAKSAKFAVHPAWCRPGHLCPAHREIAKHYKDKCKGFWSWTSWLTRRINEIELVLWDHYPDRILPDDDAGRDDLRIVLHHLGQRTNSNIDVTMWMWIAEHAPWLNQDEGASLIRYYIASKKKLPRADTLARFMGLTYADRKRIGHARGSAIRTIGAIDATKVERKAMRKAEQRLMDKARQEANRRAAGAKPRAQYEAESQARTKPWEEEGMSERTWRRHRQNAKMAGGSSPSNIIGRRPIRTDEPVPPGKSHRPTVSNRPIMPIVPIVLRTKKETYQDGMSPPRMFLPAPALPESLSKLDGSGISVNLDILISALDADRRLAAATTI